MKYRTHISAMIPLPSRTEDNLDSPMHDSFSCLFCLSLASSLPLHHDHSQYTTVYTLFWCPFQLQHAPALPGLFAPLVSHKGCFLSLFLLLRLGADVLAMPPSVVWLTIDCSSSRRMVSALAFHDLSPLCASSIHCSSQGPRSLTSCGEWLAFLLRFLVMHSTGAAEPLSLWRGIQIPLF